MKVVLITLICAILFSFSIYSQGLTGFQQFVSASSSAVNGMTVDASGYVYVIGNYTGTVDFDPSSGTKLSTTSGGTDFWLGKYYNGALVWAVPVNGPGGDYGLDIATDNSGNVYVTGQFTSTSLVWHDWNSSTTHTLAGSGNFLYYAKYNSSGQFQWAKAIGSSGVTITGKGIAFDKTLGGIYICGTFSGGVIDFDPGTGNQPRNSITGGTIFLAKYGSDGLFQKANNFGAANQTVAWANDVWADNGAVFITGKFTDRVDFGKGLLFSQSGEEFVAQFDSNLSCVFETQLFTTDGNTIDEGLRIAVDNSTPSDPKMFVAASSTNTSASHFEVFRYSSINGQVPIMVPFETTNVQYIALDGLGNLYIGGYTTGTESDWNIRGGPPMTTSIPTGKTDLFLASYTQDLLHLNWVQNLNLTPNLTSYALFGIGVTNDKLVAAGLFNGSGNFTSCGPSTTYSSTVVNGFMAEYNLKDATIAGPGSVCVGSQPSFPLQSPGTAESFSWIVTPVNDFTGSTSGTGNPAALQIANGVSGSATITYTATCGQISSTSSRTFNIDTGTPTINTISIDGITQAYPLCSSGVNITYTAMQDHIIQIGVGNDGGDPNFTLNDPSGHVSGSLLSPGRYDFISTSSTSNFTISYTTLNGCGATTQCLYFSNSGPCPVPGFTSVTINGSAAPANCTTIIPFSANTNYTIAATTNGNLPVVFTLTDGHNEVTGTVLSAFSYKVRANATTYPFTVNLQTSSSCFSAYWCLYFCTGPTCQGAGPVLGGAITNEMVNVYPNPTTSTLTVHVADTNIDSESLDQPYSLYLIDRFSQRVYTVQSSQRTLQIPTESLPADIYYLILIYKEATLQKQIIIKR